MMMDSAGHRSLLSVHGEHISIRALPWLERSTLATAVSADMGYVAVVKGRSDEPGTSGSIAHVSEDGTKVEYAEAWHSDQGILTALRLVYGDRVFLAGSIKGAVVVGQHSLRAKSCVDGLILRFDSIPHRGKSQNCEDCKTLAH